MRILLFSDPHYSVDSRIEEGKWFPLVCVWLEKIRSKFNLKTDIVGRFLSFWDHLTQRKTQLFLEKASHLGPYDFIIGLGDYTPGENERGMITEKSVRQFGLFIRLFEKYFSQNSRLLVWGDHDVGYKFNLSGKTGIKIGSETGGVSIESISQAATLIGRPFGTLVLPGARFIYLSTNLIRNVDRNSPKELRTLAKSQMKFVVNELLEKRPEYKTFLLVHDPTVLKLDAQIFAALETNASAIVLHGHLHAEFSARITRIFYPFYRNLCRRFQVQVAPAPWGMFGVGGGFLTLDLHEGGIYCIEKHKM